MSAEFGGVVLFMCRTATASRVPTAMPPDTKKPVAPKTTEGKTATTAPATGTAAPAAKKKPNPNKPKKR